jgi:hypothetical protein
MSASRATPYEQLAESYEHELELVGEGRLDEVAQLAANRAALIASLPATPPSSARPALERAQLMSKRAMIEIMRRRDAVLIELERIAQVDRTARGYAPKRARRPHVEASA